jgi:hypothetical protein
MVCHDIARFDNLAIDAMAVFGDGHGRVRRTLDDKILVAGAFTGDR